MEELLWDWAPLDADPLDHSDLMLQALQQGGGGLTVDVGPNEELSSAGDDETALSSPSCSLRSWGGKDDVKIGAPSCGSTSPDVGRTRKRAKVSKGSTKKKRQTFSEFSGGDSSGGEFLQRAPDDLALKGNDVCPRDFRKLLSLLGCALEKGEDGLLRIVHCSTARSGFVLDEKLECVQHLRTYVLSSDVPVKDRRMFDVYGDLPWGDLTWADQGNAHYVLDLSKDVQGVEGSALNPRKIQVAHALARRVQALSDHEVPVVKCFYYALSAHRNLQGFFEEDRSFEHTHKPQTSKKRKHSPRNRTIYEPLGLHKHVYMLCNQSVRDRHQILENKVWLVRYFVKGKLDARLASSVFK